MSDEYIEDTYEHRIRYEGEGERATGVAESISRLYEEDPMLEQIAAFVRTLTRPLVTFALIGAIIYLGITGALAADKVFDLGVGITAFWFATRNNAATNGGE